MSDPVRLKIPVAELVKGHRRDLSFGYRHDPRRELGKGDIGNRHPTAALTVAVLRAVSRETFEYHDPEDEEGVPRG